jgi:hypothetical protein
LAQTASPLGAAGKLISPTLLLRPFLQINTKYSTVERFPLGYSQAKILKQQNTALLQRQCYQMY